MARISLPKKKDIKTVRTWLIENNNISTEDLARLFGLSINKIQEWKIKCDVINPIDKKLFKIWVRYKHYSVSEACLILGITPRSYKYYLNKYGVNKYKNDSDQFCKQESKEIEYESIELPNTKAELEDLLENHGLRTIAKMASVSISRVRQQIRKFNINNNRDKFQSTNQFNNINWLKDKYVEKEWSLRKCANEAGVSPHTIRNWLIFHNLKPRPNGSI